MASDHANISQVEYEKMLIDACKKGTAKGQEVLYKYLFAYALNISRLFTYTKEEAEEVMNDSFMKLFSSIELVDPNQPLRSWLRRIIINTAIDNYRKNKKHYHHLDIVDIDPPVTDDDVISTLTFEDILIRLNELPSIHRLVFNLHEIESYSHNEIAVELNISVDASRVYLMRAKKKLRSLLNSNHQHYHERRFR